MYLKYKIFILHRLYNHNAAKETITISKMKRIKNLLPPRSSTKRQLNNMLVKFILSLVTIMTAFEFIDGTHAAINECKYLNW